MPHPEKLIASVLAVSMLFLAGCSKTDDATTEPSQAQPKVVSASPESDTSSMRARSLLVGPPGTGQGFMAIKLPVVRC